jgi:uncharacterized protein (DUF58 family)
MSPLERRPDFGALRHLSRIGLRARTAVEGLVSGIHKSRSMGWNVEFADFREYVPGDDIRNIDWRIYARTDRLFIRQFEEETNMRVYLVLDRSRSMSFGNGGQSKLEYACALAAALAYLFIRQGDSVGLVTVDEEIREYLPPRQSGHHLTRIWSVLEATEPGNETDLTRVLRHLASTVRRRGLLVLISDLFDHGEDPLTGLGHFRHKKFEAIVFHILDSLEIDFGLRGNHIFRDLETRNWVETSPAAVRAAYLKALRDFCENFRDGCHHLGVDYTRLDTSEPMERALLRYLSLRRRR